MSANCLDREEGDKMMMRGNLPPSTTGSCPKSFIRSFADAYGAASVLSVFRTGFLIASTKPA
jgi:hypothetical protein